MPGLVLPDVNPDWRERPDGEDLAQYYPYAAMRAGIEGRATVECVVAPDGALQDCKVLSEDPAGAGFGAATLKVTPLFKMSPAIRDGVPRASSVRIPMVWKMPEGASDEALVEEPPLHLEPADLQTTAMVLGAVAIAAAMLLIILFVLFGRRPAA